MKGVGRKKMLRGGKRAQEVYSKVVRKWLGKRSEVCFRKR